MHKASKWIAAKSRKRKIAHVSTFPPLRCGIASFAADLVLATPNFEHIKYELRYGEESAVDEHWKVGINSREALAELARAISSSNCEVVCLQHEFGIWGGHEGENIHAFLDNLRKPLLSVLHTTFRPNAKSQVQKDILSRLIRESTRVVVFTIAAKYSVEEIIGRATEKVAIIPHGIPEFQYVAPPSAWTTEGLNGGPPLRLITPGYFRPDKGLEAVVSAVRVLKDLGYNISYRIAGEPQRQFEDQSRYRARVQDLINSLDLQLAVKIDGRYLSVDEQATAIQEAHLGIFGYQEPLQASSGTVPLVMGAGRPVLCTPFEYAKAKAEEGPGVFLASGFGHNAIADAISEFIRADSYEALALETYGRTRPWRWSEVGSLFEALLTACLSSG